MSHMKRLQAPRTWDIDKKAETFVAKPYPGAHTLELSMPLNRVMISMDLADSKKEVNYVLKQKELLVDGKRRYDVRHPVGLMDVLSIPEADEHYRIVIGNKGLSYAPISKKDSKVKPVKITDKSNVKGGKTQVHTLDGRNILIDKDKYNVGDTLLIEIPSQKVKDELELKEGNLVLLYKGRHTGEIAELEGIEGTKLTFKKDGEVYETRKDYAFVIGKDKPVIEAYE